MRFMLDSDICIYLIKKRPESVIKRIGESLADGIVISSITLAELEFGVANSTYPEKNSNALIQMLSSINTLPFDSRAAAAYGPLRAALQQSGLLIGALDMLIAAHAKSLNLTLVTNNIREFSRINGLKVENWAESA